MQSAQYPQRSCREAVWTDSGIAHSCEIVDLHPGPHASFSVPASVTDRDRFEKAEPDWERNMHQATDDV